MTIKELLSLSESVILIFNRENLDNSPVEEEFFEEFDKTDGTVKSLLEMCRKIDTDEKFITFIFSKHHDEPAMFEEYEITVKDPLSIMTDPREINKKYLNML